MCVKLLYPLDSELIEDTFVTEPISHKMFFGKSLFPNIGH